MRGSLIAVIIKDGYKPFFDLPILILAHVVLLPVWILLWTMIPAMIWMSDRGPIFYRQQRLGKNGRIITVIKFRTMVMNADQVGPQWTVDEDPRVTGIGKLLRRTALDELPEVINIFRGEMSLVGPRALGVEEHRDLERRIPGFQSRLRVLPGLTGLAQLYDLQDSGEEKLKFDLEYINRMGFKLDAKLLVLSVLNTLGAHWDSRTGKSVYETENPISTKPVGTTDEGNGDSGTKGDQ